MADRYATTGNNAAITGAASTSLTLHSLGTTHRAEIFYAAFSAGGTMADQVVEEIVQRLTALGTEGATAVPTPFDGAAPAAIFDGGQNHSVEPTYTAATELWDENIHVRALAQLQLQPDGHWMLPATLNAGIGSQELSAAYTGEIDVTYHFLE